MEELLSLNFFSEILKPAHIKMIVFAWSIVKCTLLFVISLKVFSVLSQKIIDKFLLVQHAKLENNS